MSSLKDAIKRCIEALDPATKEHDWYCDRCNKGYYAFLTAYSTPSGDCLCERCMQHLEMEAEMKEDR